MEQDADVYFAQHDIPSVVSDMLFELGFHRPKDVGKFIAGYVDRRFKLEGAVSGVASTGGAARTGAEGQPGDEDFSTIEVRSAPASMGSDEATACALLEEVRALRRKYRDFVAQVEKGAPLKSRGEAEDGAAAENGEESQKSFQVIPWSEFRTDYERLLLVFQSPLVWAFCERRLATLRGLFDAHSALNAGLEEAEVVSAPPPTRVDNCVQVGRALAPGRLMHLYRKKAASEAASTTEVAPGQTLNDLVGRLGRPPGPADLSADADERVQGTVGLRAVFSRTSNHLRGQFLAEATAASFRLLEATDATGSGETFAEYRLPLHPESGAWLDLARWVEEFEVKSPRVHWVMQLPQNAYGGLKERRSVLNFGEFLTNVFGPPAAAVQHRENAEAEQLSKLLQSVAAFEVLSVEGAADERLSAEADAEPEEWSAASSPPFAYQIYHVWARLKVLNACRAAASQSPQAGLRAAASTAEPLSAAYMLGARSMARCGALGVHAPLQYLFLLDGVVATVSLTSHRSLGGAGEAGPKTFERLFKVGVGVALCSEDNTVSAQCDDALGHEYALARSTLGLSQADLAEIALCSAAAAGACQGAQVEQEKPTKTVRQRYRAGRRDAELALLARMAPQAVPGAALGGALDG